MKCANIRKILIHWTPISQVTNVWSYKIMHEQNIHSRGQDESMGFNAIEHRKPSDVFLDSKLQVIFQNYHLLHFA